MRKTCAILFLAIIAAAGRADTVRVGKIPYSRVRITDARDGKVFFQVTPTVTLAKPAHLATLVELEGKTDFNRAEQLLADGKPEQAVAHYDRALSKAGGWVRRLIRYRRLIALDRAGRIQRAGREWLALVDESADAAEVLNLRPSTPAAKGSARNAGAIELLEARAKRPRIDPLLAEQINALLLVLYEREGRDEDARRMAGRMSEVRLPEKRLPRGGGRLTAAKVLIDQGEAERALGVIRANLTAGRYSDEDVPAALFLAGKAQQKLAEVAGELERRSRIVGAGLDFMRVATFFRSHARAPEALVGAAEMNAALGNSWAASRAYEAVVRRYPDSAAARKAAAALEALKRERRSVSKRNP